MTLHSTECFGYHLRRTAFQMKRGAYRPFKLPVHHIMTVAGGAKHHSARRWLAALPRAGRQTHWLLSRS